MASVEKHLPRGEEVLFRTKRAASLGIIPIGFFLGYVALVVYLYRDGWLGDSMTGHVHPLVIIVFGGIGVGIFIPCLLFFLWYYYSEFVLTRKRVLVIDFDGVRVHKRFFLLQAIAMVEVEWRLGWYYGRFAMLRLIPRPHLVVTLKDGTEHSYYLVARGKEFARRALAQVRERQAETGAELAPARPWGRRTLPRALIYALLLVLLFLLLALLR